jgi:hypothetical protein
LRILKKLAKKPKPLLVALLERFLLLIERDVLLAQLGLDRLGGGARLLGLLLELGPALLQLLELLIQIPFDLDLDRIELLVEPLRQDAAIGHGVLGELAQL